MPLKVTITSIYGDSKNAIYVDVYIKKGTVRALIDSRSKLDLINPGIVQRLELPYKAKEQAIKIEMADRSIPIYRDKYIRL